MLRYDACRSTISLAHTLPVLLDLAYSILCAIFFIKWLNLGRDRKL